MTIDITDWTMISDISPESAFRETGSGAAVWRLSWLPNRLLTREQALAGMELDEILSKPDIVHDQHAHADAIILAGRIGIIWEQALILLWKRILARLSQRPDEIDDGPMLDDETAGRSPLTRPMSLHTDRSV